MDKSRAEKLVQLLFRTAPPFRRNYINPPKGRECSARLPHHQLFCLMILRQSGRESMGTLAEKMGVSNQQITRIVKELAENGLAARTFDESDRRSVYVSPTPKGLEYILQQYRFACEHMEKQLTNWPEEDIDALIFHLSAIADILDKAQNENI